jgi:hypothetical protein
MTEEEVRTESGAGSGLQRYWPVALVLLVVAAVVAIGALVVGGDDDDGEVTSPDTTEAEGEGSGGEGGNGGDGMSDIEAWAAADPMSAPDCDTETGRIMVPSVYAPNCVPLWPEGGDNGGATHRGVTADEIVVAVYQGQQTAAAQGAIDNLGLADLSDEEVAENRTRLVGAYNDLYETYGRTVRWEPLEASGGPSDEAAARADAIRAAEEIGAFAVIGGPSGTNAFVEELVDREVICLCTNSQPAEAYVRWAPYVWGGLMASSQTLIQFAEYVDMRVAFRPAEFAGDPAFRERERVIGGVRYETADGAYEEAAAFMGELLEDRGIDVVVSIAYIYGTGDNLAEDAATAVSRLKEAGVTTVMFSGDPIMPIYLTQAATAQDYYPEWMMSGLTALDVRGFARQYDQDQWRNAFGLSLLLPPIDPDYTQRAGNLISWHLGEELTSYPGFYEWGRLFQGVHLAGPVLTPESFGEGLFSFLRVQAHQTEYGVSYGEGVWPLPDYTGADDVTEIWWDPDAIDPTELDEVRGMYRYTDGARRFGPGEINQLSGSLFDPEGTVIYFEERPEGDRPPQYPRRSGRAG